MNTNLFQTLMTVASGILAAAIPILLGLGCTLHPITQAIDCTATTAPVWLAPWLGVAVMVINVVKVILAAFEGKLAKPTVAVPNGTEAVIIPKAPSQ